MKLTPEQERDLKDVVFASLADDASVKVARGLLFYLQPLFEEWLDDALSKGWNEGYADATYDYHQQEE